MATPLCVAAQQGHAEVQEVQGRGVGPCRGAEGIGHVGLDIDRVWTWTGHRKSVPNFPDSLVTHLVSCLSQVVQVLTSSPSV